MQVRNGLSAAIAAAALALSATHTFAEECRMAGGSADMVTRGLAEFMANAALKNSIADHGWTAKGPIKMECRDDTFTTHCLARRLACK